MTKSDVAEMFKEGGVYSLVRVLPTIGYLVFLLVSIYFAIKGTLDYGTFAATTGGSGAIAIITNKAINSKWNTPQGEIGKKIGDKR